MLSVEGQATSLARRVQLQERRGAVRQTMAAIPSPAAVRRTGESMVVAARLVQVRTESLEYC